MKQWELTLVGPECSMEEAIATLDRVAVRIVMVVDQERRLLGTLTDGDVRRALLKQKALTTQVSDVMCSKPRTAGPSWSRERIMAVMDTYQLLQLPVVDADGTVIGLETLHELLTRRRRDNPVFLMAGGLVRDCVH